MNSKSLYLTFGVIILVLVSTLGLLMYVKTTSKPGTTSQIVPETAQQTPAGQAVVAIQPKLTMADGDQTVELWLNPLATNQPLSTLALKATIQSATGAVRSLSNDATMGEAFKAEEWTIPFSRVEKNEDGSLTLSLTAVYVSTQAYILGSEPVLLASFPVFLDQNTQLTVTIDPEISKLFDKQATLLLFAESGQPLPVTAL